jgi:hypothetical protein
LSCATHTTTAAAGIRGSRRADARSTPGATTTCSSDATSDTALAAATTTSYSAADTETSTE